LTSTGPRGATVAAEIFGPFAGALVVLVVAGAVVVAVVVVATGGLVVVVAGGLAAVDVVFLCELPQAAMASTDTGTRSSVGSFLKTVSCSARFT
jgi:hypothetical protein